MSVNECPAQQAGLVIHNGLLISAGVNLPFFLKCQLTVHGLQYKSAAISLIYSQLKGKGSSDVTYCSWLA